MEKDIKKKKCGHKNWRCAGYKEEKGVYKVTSLYYVYCNDCHNFVNLLNGKIINDKGLVLI